MTLNCADVKPHAIFSINTNLDPSIAPIFDVIADIKARCYLDRRYIRKLIKLIK